MKDVSIVIPSYKRHDEVVRAVKSALAQTYSPLEVIVSNDGQDPAKAHLLSALNDNRVRYVEAPRRGIASATRNFGLKHAQGSWIALLDDDDIWLPRKLEAQFAALESSGLNEAILAGVEVVYSESQSSHVRPSCAVPVDLPVCEVLFCGYGGVHTSTLVAPRWAFDKYVFNEALERHEDWSWLLLAGLELGLVVSPERVCERHLSPGERLSRAGGYAYSRQWYDQHKDLMTPQACAAFVASILSRKAAHGRSWRTLTWLVGEVRRQHGLNFTNLARLMRPWLVPERMRKVLKAKVVRE